MRVPNSETGEAIEFARAQCLNQPSRLTQAPTY